MRSGPGRRVEVHPGADEVCRNGVDDDCDGSAGACVPSSIVLSAADARFEGEQADDDAGTALSGAGDVDGDGLADVLVGAPFNDDAGANAGAAYLILGRSGATSIPLSGADAQYTGEAPNDYAGFGVSDAGDVNGDGLDDVLLGSRYSDSSAEDAGIAYLVLGIGI